jgi:glutaredoxin-like YruB-family protein
MISSVNPGGKNSLAKIVLYTQPDCPPCEIAKHFLSDYGFSYELKNIKKDRAARDELVKKYSSYSTPTFVINDERVITGFDMDELKKALGIK